MQPLDLDASRERIEFVRVYGSASGAGRISSLVDEARVLADEVERWRGDDAGHCDALHSEIDRLNAEVERLRTEVANLHDEMREMARDARDEITWQQQRSQF